MRAKLEQALAWSGMTEAVVLPADLVGREDADSAWAECGTQFYPVWLYIVAVAVLVFALGGVILGGVMRAWRTHRVPGLAVALSAVIGGHVLLYALGIADSTWERVILADLAWMGCYSVLYVAVIVWRGRRPFAGRPTLYSPALLVFTALALVALAVWSGPDSTTMVCEGLRAAV